MYRLCQYRQYGSDGLFIVSAQLHVPKHLRNFGMSTSPPPLEPQLPLPPHGALLGLDFGTKRMGVAISNTDQTVAVPVETWQVRDPNQNLKHLRELIDDYRAVGIVLGLPIRTNGEEGTAAAVVREFGTWVATKTALPLVYIDERYSSAEAELLIWRRGESPLNRKRPLDSLAAKIILQSYLDDPACVVKPPETKPGKSGSDPIS
jgi:putative Holliday junction resolvase